MKKKTLELAVRNNIMKMQSVPRDEGRSQNNSSAIELNTVANSAKSEIEVRR